MQALFKFNHWVKEIRYKLKKNHRFLYWTLNIFFTAIPYWFIAYIFILTPALLSALAWQLFVGPVNWHDLSIPLVAAFGVIGVIGVLSFLITLIAKMMDD